MSVPAGHTLAELIDHLAVSLGDDFRKTLMGNDGRPHTEYAIILNKHFIAPKRLTEVSIRDKSKINIIPIIGGG